MSAFAMIVALACMLGGSWLVGRAALVLADARALGGLELAFGLSLLLLVAVLGVRLPGHGTSAAVVLVTTVLVAAWIARRDLVMPDRAVLVAMGLVAVAGVLPFLAEGRFGILGVGKLDDVGSHWALADSLRLNIALPLTGALNSYPIAPHALAAGLVSLLGSDDPAVFTALMLVTVIAMGAVAATAITDGPAWMRGLCAAAAAFGFLPAAYFGQFAFKDLIAALFTFAFAVALERVAADRDWRRGTVALLALLAAGAFGTLGAPGPAWLVGTLGVWLVATAVATRWRPNGADVKRVVVLGATAVGVLIALSLPQIDRLVTFNAAENAAGGGDQKAFLGNLWGYLPLRQVLGVWPSGDFRLEPSNMALVNGLAIVFTIGIVAALVSDARKRRFALGSAFIAALVIYLATRQIQGPYVTAKAMVILAPLAVCVLLRGLLSVRVPTLRIAAYGAGAVAAALMLWSSSLALRSSNVGSLSPALDLRTFSPAIEDREVLFIGYDNFVAWELIDARVAMVAQYSINPAFPIEFRKRIGSGVPVDPDAVTPATYAKAELAITSSTGYISRLPGDWTPIQRSSFYTLWKRNGPVPDKQLIEAEGLPGSKLQCRRGVPSIGADAQALVRREPIGSPGPQWRYLDGTAPVTNPNSTFAEVPPGATVRQRLTLAPGEWDLSLQYSGSRNIQVDAEGFSRTLPSNLETYGALWPVGRVRATGEPTDVYVTVADKTPIGRQGGAALGTIVATRDDADRTLPAEEACGMYLDGYITP
ncbi:hypothetical protein OJ997_18860 [Solirubrobacter phytolaccae]|uniref:Uncharacterized protein n=1 Tax=Solirubrobacter phytolaccae TaxID=1404360 RepID=A0A9X3SAB3_9ACTN|nr:hypothetical protein [Solirubrobacter phytolaccae]MDA0182376.1 hypothetical protein [Solirubrobacter phytolaccae]